MSRKKRRHNSPDQTRAEPTPAQPPEAFLSITERELIAGPLPSPQVLAQYDEIQPGLVERIVAMAEKQAEHRQGLEKAVVGGNVEAQKRGQFFAFVLALVVVGVGAWLVVNGNLGWGITLILGDVAALAGVFVYGRKQQRNEREHRWKKRQSPAAK